MKRRILLLCSLATLALMLIAASAQATFSDDKAELDFPQTVTFSVTVQSPVEIKSIVLEYGEDKLTCGNVIAKAYPDFTPGKSASVTWKWDMRQSGSLPPGAKLWWRWVVTDTGGNQTASPRKEITWLDSTHAWQSLGGERINLHWYQGDKAFGQTLHTTAVDALKHLDAEAGLKIEEPVDIYIYGKTEDMRDAILFEPSWTGGLAYPPYNIVIIGIHQGILEWGKLTEAHELTHVVIGHLTFNCLWSVPTWLNEGLAVYSEGQLDESSQKNFDQAIRDDTLMSLRSLSGGFSEKSDKADLSYSQSFSVVKFLIETYKRDKMTALLKNLRDGNTADEALQAVYGFDTDGLEDAWRAGIGAKARAVTGAATPTTIPTIVPTIRPVSGIPGADVTPVATPVVTAIAKSVATSSATESANSPTPAPTRPIAPDQQPISQSTMIALLLISVCCIGILGILVIVIIILVVRRSGRQNDAQQ